VPRASTLSLRNLLETGRYGIHYDVLIERLDTPSTSVMQSYSNFGGVNWIHSGSLTLNVDQGVSSGSLRLIRSHGDLSLAPKMEMSALNRDSLDDYSPALDFRREVEIRVAITYQTTLPNAYDPNKVEYDVGDWITLFQGLTDAPISYPDEFVEVPIVGRSAYMVGASIFTAEEYGSEEGTPVLDVMQALSDRWLPGFYTIQVSPEEPEFLIRKGFVNPQQLIEAMKAFTAQFGGRFEDRWSNVTREFGPTIVMPDREKVTPDLTMTADQYVKLHQMALDPTNLRTVFRVPYTNRETGIQEIVQYPEDPDTDPLVQKYGPIGIQLAEDAASAIDTREEALAFLGFARQDLGTVPVPIEFETLLNPLVELDDLVAFQPDGVTTDTVQNVALYQITHTLESPGKGRTRMLGSGAAKGAYASWLNKSAQAQGFNAYTDSLRLFNYRKTTSGDEAGETLSWVRDRAVEEVWRRYATYPEGTADPWEQLAAVVPVPMGALNTLYVPKPDYANRTYVEVMPARSQGGKIVFGRVWRVEVFPPPPAAPTLSKGYAETAIVSTVRWNVTERGREVAEFQTRTQIGREAPGPWGSPSRSSGAAAVVTGDGLSATLGALDFEQDVSRSMEHISYVEARMLMEDGETISLEREAFDWNDVPDIQYVKIVSPKTVEMLSDSRDTLSIRLMRTDVADSDPAYWEKWVDGTFYVFSVPVPDGETWAMSGVAYGAPKAIAGPSTPQDSEPIQVLGTGATVAVSWNESTSELNKQTGNALLSLVLDAEGTVTGLSTRVLIHYNTGAGEGADTNITASLSPVPTTPPTSPTSYTYNTGYTEVEPDIGLDGLPRGRLVTATVTAEILDGAVLKHSRQFITSWYY
jgi:hypothetical protein